MEPKTHREINSYLIVVLIVLLLADIILTMYAKAEMVIMYEELKYSVECNADSIFKILTEGG